MIWLVAAAWLLGWFLIVLIGRKLDPRNMFAISDGEDAFFSLFVWPLFVGYLLLAVLYCGIVWAFERVFRL